VSSRSESRDLGAGKDIEVEGRHPDSCLRRNDGVGMV
tara:strand:+ start:3446 stop:3556 length:111 start_codon:yes stop_codon:yes gene_type:complete